MPGTALNASCISFHLILTATLSPWVPSCVHFTEEILRRSQQWSLKLLSPCDTPEVHIFVPFTSHILGLHSFSPPKCPDSGKTQMAMQSSPHYPGCSVHLWKPRGKGWLPRAGPEESSKALLRQRCYILWLWSPAGEQYCSHMHQALSSSQPLLLNQFIGMRPHFTSK